MRMTCGECLVVTRRAPRCVDLAFLAAFYVSRVIIRCPALLLTVAAAGGETLLIETMIQIKILDNFER